MTRELKPKKKNKTKKPLAAAVDNLFILIVYASIFLIINKTNLDNFVTKIGIHYMFILISWSVFLLTL